MIMVSIMDDISGKKFSLQDWVTRRAANQAGGIASRVSEVESVQPVAIKRAVNGDNHSAKQDDMPEAVVKATSSSGSSGVVASSASSASIHEDAERSSGFEISPKDDRGVDRQGDSRSALESMLQKPESKMSANASSSVSNTANPVQQLQIVRLLSDLGERLRQSEKEREVLWKELESCRKLIGDLDSKNSASQKSFDSLQEKVSQKDDFIQGLLDKQTELETLVQSQNKVLEASQNEQQVLKGKLEDKLSNIETAAGSAIVRIEDALVENSKLAKRVEQLGQDKARLVRKLEVMEETLAQTQETLKAKALVLLTDQALAARTNLPQSPAWTGDDTLKVSQPRSPASAERGADVSDRGPLSDIAESIRQQQKASDISNKAFLMALFVLVIAAGVLISQINFKSVSFIPTSGTSEKVQVGEESGDVSSFFPQEFKSAAEDRSVIENGIESVSSSVSVAPTQEQLMADIAEMASQIEPSSVNPTEIVAEEIVSEPNDFDKAINAEDAALEKFQSEAPKGSVETRIKPNAALPKSVKDIENLAFQGDAKAQHDLAAIYTAGHAGVKVNYDLAAKWFSESAHQNIANAQYNLGVLTQQGLGVEKNIGRAIDLYRVAAANNHPEAQYNLAIAYIEGVGTEYNPQIAASYFQRAASGGIVEAAYNLGLLHENGLLGESQPDEAVFWYSMAAGKGSDQAKDALRLLQNQLSMSDADVSRIVERIAQTKPGFLDKEGQPSLPDPSSAALPDIQGSTGSVSEVNQTAADVAAVSSSVTDPSVVLQIQEQLSRMGYYKGAPDGSASQAMKEAVLTYQKSHGLRQDGVASENLLVQILASGE